MNNFIASSIGFVLGVGVGYGIGHYVNAKKYEKKETEYVEPVFVEQPQKNPQKENLEEHFQKTLGEGSLYSEVFKSKPAKEALKPGETGINYSAYVKDLKYKQETQVPPEGDENDISEEDEDEIDMSKYEETYEERLERENKELVESAAAYKKHNKGKIELMQSDEWDTDFRDNDYERGDLYYFTESDILTDEDGNQLDEVEYIGPKVRQVGWMQSPDNIIYIRNHPKEMEYRVFKQRCTVEEWWS